MPFPLLTWALTALLSTMLLMSLNTHCGGVEFDEHTIKNASVDDIKKWLIINADGRGLLSQWKLLATRSERLSWWTEVIGCPPFIIRKRRAVWDPNAKAGKYLVDDSQSKDVKKSLFIVVAELPSDCKDTTLVGINLVNVDDFDK